jgi:hypothetical protein
MSVRHLDIDRASSGAPRSTGLQMMVASFAAALDAAERTATPQEYAVGLEILQLTVARKRARYERWLRRAA